MARYASFPHGTTERMIRLLKKAKTATELKRIQCVLLGSRNIPSEEIASLVGYNYHWVKEIWIRFRRDGEKILSRTSGVGNRNRAHLSTQNEKAFIEPFFEKAKKGGILIVKEIHDAYEKKLQCQVYLSVVYDLLHRHGWRKIVPRPSHPKTDTVAQEVFRTSFPPDHKGGIRRIEKNREEVQAHVSG